MEAEIRALFDGMFFCRAQGIINVTIESDFAVVVNILEDANFVH